MNLRATVGAPYSWGAKIAQAAMTFVLRNISLRHDESGIFLNAAKKPPAD
jgi:hypothetical protein